MTKLTQHKIASLLPINANDSKTRAALIAAGCDIEIQNNVGFAALKLAESEPPPFSARNFASF